MSDVTLAALLREHPFGDDEPLVHTTDRSVTAGETRAAVARLAGQLRAAGVGVGQAVIVALPNGPEGVEAMFGVWEAGAVFVPVNPRAPETEVARVIEAIEPAALVAAQGVELVDGSPRAYELDTAFVMWTSGTTGDPKPILHSHTAYLELIDRVLEPLRGGERAPGHRPTPNLIPVSLALNAGIYNVLFGLRAGAPLVIMDRFDPVEFARLVRRFEVRSTVLPPAAMTMLCDDAAVTDLTPLRYVRSITAPLSPLQARRFTDKFGAYVLNSYGQAEMGEVIGWTAADAKAHPDKLGALGRPHRGVDVRINGDPEGELLVRTERMAMGYAGGEDLSDRIDSDGFVRTGDIGYVDDDGFVWLSGRVNDLINRGGNKVHPDQVEEVLRLSPGVEDAAVVGVADPRLGEVPVAFVVEREPVTDEALDSLCREHLVAYKVPVAYRRLDRLPRNEAGKVLRRELTAMISGPSTVEEESDG